MNNVLFVDKPAGISSFDVCFRLRKVLHTKKIGHTGTLDPGATGVMIVLFDKATKANQFLVSDSKEYSTRVLLGVSTDTLDTDGKIIEEGEYTVPEKEELEAVLKRFTGNLKQEVPITSAVKVDGERLYRYQQKNLEVELPIRDIHVYSIRLDEIYADGFSFTCKVSSGTYIRALVRDILKELKLIGTVAELRRIAIGNITIEDCDPLDNILEGDYKSHDLLELLSSRYETVYLDDLSDVRNGKPLQLNSRAEKILISDGKEAVAIYQKQDGSYRCVRGLW
ncbi:MAG: tRNA pseudouridine(55) synthase TruB [Erysipelotrichaceae bacterium]|nr:tRNA pseudouridine(55) synthase TruB [Erysipelotrichaceae bacterium]